MNYDYRTLEKQCQIFEKAGASTAQFMEGLPIVIRMDGNNFSSFVSGLSEPYDERLSNLMIETCKFAVDETNAKMGFVGSDEISLVLYSEDYKSQLYYNRVARKIISILAGKVSVFFNNKLKEYLPEKVDSAPSFDCRAWNVPNLQEACNALYVREQSIYKNSITMACMGNSLYSHNDIEGVNGRDKQEMLFKKGINYNDYPVHFKRGVYVQRRKFERVYTPTEIEVLPKMHQARFNPNLVIERTEIRVLELPIFSTITNPIELLFNGDEPKTDKEVVS